MRIMPIGENLRTIREEKKLSQQELARLSSITSGYISKIENGKINPSADKLKKLLIALEVTGDRLLFDEHELEVSEELKELFKKASTLNEDKKYIIKQVLRAFIAQSVAEELSR